MFSMLRPVTATFRPGINLVKLYHGGGIQHLLDPVDVGGEGGDDDPVLASLELALEGGAHRLFRGGKARTLHIGGVRQQCQDALLPQLAEAGKVDDLPVDGGGVDLEVAGVDDGAHVGVDGKGHGVGDGVVDMDELDLKAAELEPVARTLGENLRVVQQVVLLKLELYDARRQRRGIYGDVEVAHDVGQGADVVLVSVCDYYAFDAVFILLQVRDIGYDDINAVELLVRKPEAAVHDDNVLPVLVHGEVLANLTETAERNDFKFCHLLLLFCKNICISTAIRIITAVSCYKTKSAPADSGKCAGPGALPAAGCAGEGMLFTCKSRRPETRSHVHAPFQRALQGGVVGEFQV